MPLSNLSEDDKRRLVEGCQIMGDSNMSDIVEICFHGKSAVLPQLQQYMEENKAEFEEYRQHAPQYFDAMIARLQDFEKANGHQHVKEAQDRELFWWVHWQKHLMDRLKLSEENETKLFKIKFDFREDDKWETNLHGWDTRRTT